MAFNWLLIKLAPLPVMSCILQNSKINEVVQLSLFLAVWAPFPLLPPSHEPQHQTLVEEARGGNVSPRQYLSKVLG